MRCNSTCKILLGYVERSYFLASREKEDSLFRYRYSRKTSPWVTSFVFLTRLDVHKRTHSPKHILLTKFEYIATREARFDEVVSGDL